jgi:hypothetical protein
MPNSQALYCMSLFLLLNALVETCDASLQLINKF